jgi:AcrR family transcriptional regulator
MMTKAEIIDAAFKVWGRNFYRKTSLSQLAGELGVSKAALYRHFLNKKALIEAMTDCFLDEFINAVTSEYEQALHANDPVQGSMMVIRAIAVYFAHNAYALVFSLINLNPHNTEEYKKVTLKLKFLNNIFDKNNKSPISMYLFTSLTFFMAHFHKKNNSFENPPSKKDCQRIIDMICRNIENGLGRSKGEIDKLDLSKLEKKVKRSMQITELDPVLKAVSQALAKAGPWEISMDMVAQKLKLSKSSLYGHFKNKHDMIYRYFSSELTQVINHAQQGLGLSENPVEQLYLGIFSIAFYLISKPDLLASLAWFRTRKLDVEKPEMQDDFLGLFGNIKIESLQSASKDEKRQISHLIFFLIIIILMHQAQDEKSLIKNIRSLYRFITLGLKDCIK